MSNLSKIIVRHPMPPPFQDYHTTPLFWSCNCMEDYVHAVAELECLRCGVKRENAPDSRVSDVLMNQDIRNMKVGDILEDAAAEMGIIEPIPY